MVVEDGGLIFALGSTSKLILDTILNSEGIGSFTYTEFFRPCYTTNCSKFDTIVQDPLDLSMVVKNLQDGFYDSKTIREDVWHDVDHALSIIQLSFPSYNDAVTKSIRLQDNLAKQWNKLFANVATIPTRLDWAYQEPLSDLLTQVANKYFDNSDSRSGSVFRDIQRLLAKHKKKKLDF